MQQQPASPRHRVNVTRSTTGKMAWDWTVELVGGSIEDVLAESDGLVAELKRRYPLEEVQK